LKSKYREKIHSFEFLFSENEWKIDKADSTQGCIQGEGVGGQPPPFLEKFLQFARVF